MVLLRDKQGRILEIPAREAPDRLNAELNLLSVLMHAQHEGASIMAILGSDLFKTIGGSGIH